MREYSIILEELKLKVADNEAYITEVHLGKEKKEIEEEKKQVELEEQYLKEKQITQGRVLSSMFITVRQYLELKNKIADNEVYITEILEKKAQIEEEKQIITG